MAQQSISQRREYKKRGSSESSAIEPRACLICKDMIMKHTCIHYGGLSCYSCRAFFRRANQESKKAVFECKFDGNCEVTVKTRRKCQKCRYELCLKAGMRPENVLTPDQKSVRFRKKRMKTESTSSATSGNGEDAFLGFRNNSPGANAGESLSDPCPSPPALLALNKDNDMANNAQPVIKDEKLEVASLDANYELPEIVMDNLDDLLTSLDLPEANNGPSVVVEQVPPPPPLISKMDQQYSMTKQ